MGVKIERIDVDATPLSGICAKTNEALNGSPVPVPPCQCCGKPMLFRNEYRQGEQCRWCGTFTPDSR